MNAKDRDLRLLCYIMDIIEILKKTVVDSVTLRELDKLELRLANEDWKEETYDR